MSREPSTGRVRTTYEFIKAHRGRFSVQALCRVLDVAPSGYYAWFKQPLSNRALEDARLLRLIRASFIASQGIYGAPRVFLDLREAGETCSKHRVVRLMRENRLRALHGYRTRRWSVGKPAALIPNLLQRQFTVTRPNKAWVTDITYIRTWQGWLYLAVVLDLFSRKIVGWSARPTIHRELVLDAVLMAVRRRRPRGTLIHSDQGTQVGSDAWRRFCRSHRLEPSMSRKGNCWDNAVVESFFGSLKKERVKKHIYRTRELAVADMADYIDTLLPLLVDLVNPSPDQGWRGRERASLTARGRPDALLALAVVHHMAIARNIPLHEIVTLLTTLAPAGVIGFVSNTDQRAHALFRGREEIFRDYTLEKFLSLLRSRARVLRQQPIAGTGRVLISFSAE